MGKCPYCGGKLTTIMMSSVCGEKWYDECFECGYCSEEEYEEGYYFGDPDAEYDDWVSSMNTQE